MRRRPARPPARVFTMWGAVVYVDQHGELRHGNPATSPANAFLAPVSAATDAVGFVYAGPDGLASVACAEDHSKVRPRDGESGSASLELVALERGLFGLRQGDKYLCAEPDGRITASRTRCSVWEQFVGSEMWCATPAAAALALRDGVDRRAVQHQLVDPRLRRLSDLKSDRPKVLIYGYPKWSHGRVYYDVMTRLWRAGYVVDLINWQQDHSAYFGDLLDYYDLILTAPDGVRTLVNAYRVPTSRLIVVSHHENDIRMLVEQKGRDIFDEFAGYGVVSYYVYCASMMQGVRRPPTVVSLGIDFDAFYAPVPRRLEVVGYASSMSDVSFGVEWKRGHLAEAAARAAGLEFKVAGSTGAQTSFHEMPEFYRTVDAVLTSSISEAAQLPVMEGAAAGRLVIGTPVGHFPLRAYQGGGIIAPIEADKFVAFVSETLARYRDDPAAFQDRCRSIQEAAHQFDWANSFHEWLELIEAAASRSPASTVAEVADVC